MAITFQKGEKLNNLTILEDTYSYSKSDANGGNKRRYWKCLCDCGEITYVSATALKGGTTKSCGCLNKEKTIAKCRIDETGNRYGNLLVLEYSHTENNRAYWRCQCDCGNIVDIQAPHLRTGNTISCGKCSRVSRGEIKIKQFLEENNIDFAQEVRFSECKDKQMLPFDFAIYKNKILVCLIEFQGRQHFEATGGWSTQEHLKYIQKHDEIKQKWAKTNNIPLYIITYNQIDSINMIMKEILDENIGSNE